MKKTAFPIIVFILIVVSSCTQKTPVVSDWDSYISEHEAWQQKRIERLKSENGWLNLAGLLWLKEGENTFGSDAANSIVFPEKFPSFGGKIILTDSIARLIANENVEIKINEEIVSEFVLQNDQQKNTTTMELGSFRWFIIKRGDKYGIRLRDLEHPRISAFDHIPSYPFSKEWVVESEFVAYDSVRTLKVPTAINDFYEFYKVPGVLQFKINGKKQNLLPFKSGDGFFLIIGDATNGVDTYGAGRFLYANKSENGKILIDFNKAYNPPCAFSPFATCPLPPLENILDISIEAGEKGVHLD